MEKKLKRFLRKLSKQITFIKRMYKSMNKIKELPSSEFIIMQVIWKSNEALSAKQIIDLVLNDNEWSPKTIRTLIGRLVDKDFLSKKRKQDVYMYAPIIDEDIYKRHSTKSLLNKLYDGTLSSLVMNFGTPEELTEEEIKDLKKLLDKIEK